MPALSCGPPRRGWAHGRHGRRYQAADQNSLERPSATARLRAPLSDVRAADSLGTDAVGAEERPTPPGRHPAIIDPAGSLAPDRPSMYPRQIRCSRAMAPPLKNVSRLPTKTIATVADYATLIVRTLATR